MNTTKLDSLLRDLLQERADLLKVAYWALPLLRREAMRDHGDQQITAAADDRLEFTRKVIARCEEK